MDIGNLFPDFTENFVYLSNRLQSLHYWRVPLMEYSSALCHYVQRKLKNSCNSDKNQCFFKANSKKQEIQRIFNQLTNIINEIIVFIGLFGVNTN